MTLPKALEPFNNYRQFITFTTRPGSKPGKVDKIPTNFMTGLAHDAHDPAIWTDYTTAFNAGDGKVGFVFTENDPFWFVDIDNCLLPDNSWSPLAQEICGLLSGAAVEISQSGKGLHIFGTGVVPRHSTRAPGLEFYNTGRFVALGSNSVGNAWHDCSAGIQTMVERYFSRVQEDKPLPEWSDVPVPEWRGSVDDDDLIRRLRQSKSTASVFGSKASAEQLWDAQLGALSIAYPADDRPYDASSADAALAQHLAFWTGKNCERMLKLMMRSKLYRQKWERDDYLRRTILNACAKQVDVCKDKPQVDISGSSGRAEVINEPIYLNPEMQLIYFGGCTYIADINRILAPKGDYYDREAFDFMFGNGCSFMLDHANNKLTDSAWDCFKKSKAVKFPKAKRSCFNPLRDVGSVWSEGGRDVANSYWPIETGCIDGNAEPFLNHLNKLFRNDRDREIIISYMAAVVQYKGVKFRWAPLIQGTRGNGKTLLSHCLTAAIGIDHCHWPKASDFATGRFNDWLDGKIFIAVEDIYVPHEKEDVLEALKPLITGERGVIEGKGKSQVTRNLCANFMLNSNHKNALRMTKDNRGIAVFYTHQQDVDDLALDGMDEHYFFNLFNWLKRDGYAIVHNFLKHYKIKEEYNPATLCQRAPTTTSTKEAIHMSMGTIEQEILAAVAEDKIGFRGGWISTHYLDLLLRDLGIRNHINRNRRKEILESLNYMRHPGVRAGQVTNPVSPDGCKPSVYILKDHACSKLVGGAVGNAYSAAQAESISARLSLVPC